MINKYEIKYFILESFLENGSFFKNFQKSFKEKWLTNWGIKEKNEQRRIQ